MIVLEKKTHPRKKICGGGISAYAEYWLKRLGTKMSITSELKRLRIIAGSDDYVKYVLPAGKLRTVVREDFDNALVR